MFESLRIKNFRSIRDSGEVSLSNLNVLVGPNNSGKSSVLYAIMLIKMTLEDRDEKLPLITYRPELDLGSYLDLIRDQETRRKLFLQLRFDEQAAEPFKVYGPEFGGRQSSSYGVINVELRFDQASNEIEVVSFSGSDLLNNNILNVKKTAQSKWRITGPPRKLIKHMTLGFSHFIPTIIPFGPRPKDKSVTAAIFEWNMMSTIRARIIENSFENVKYIAPIRERIPRHAKVGTMAYSELGPSGQNLMRVLSSSKLVGTKNRTAKAELNYWLDKRFKLLKNVDILDIDPEKTIKSIIADDPSGGKRINLASMGCGISQLVPIVVQTVLLPENGCLLVEQPEIHLHPSAQADLADLFIQNIKRNRQFIVETHSEHFVLRLRRRIAERKVKPEKVGIFFVEKQGGVTKIRRLSLKPNGHFEEWPAGFFEEGFEEALAIAKAGSKP